jgi:hypothetical protein
LREYGEIIVAAGDKMDDQREPAGIIPFEAVEAAVSRGIA